MSKIHMKKCSPSLAIKEMQIKTSLRFHLTTIRKAMNKTPTTGVDKNVGEKEPYTLLVGMQVSETIVGKKLESSEKSKQRSAI
jgi:hypothetical protein